MYAAMPSIDAQSVGADSSDRTVSRAASARSAGTDEPVAASNRLLVNVQAWATIDHYATSSMTWMLRATNRKKPFFIVGILAPSKARTPRMAAWRGH